MGYREITRIEVACQRAHIKPIVDLHAPVLVGCMSLDKTLLLSFPADQW